MHVATSLPSAMGKEIRLGAGSFRSVADMWHHRIESTPDAEAMVHKSDGRFISLTWEEAGRAVRSSIAMARNVTPGSCFSRL